jgi:predicted short-subunit dehydrogenase-like oxidoreductase (DUF2520 family)
MTHASASHVNQQPGNLRLGIIGGGRAAWAFGSSWRHAGMRLSGVWLRKESASRLPELLQAPRRTLEDLAHDSDLLLIAATDRAIVSVSEMIPATRAIIFHASGAVGSVRDGFSLHPLKSLPPVGEPSDLAGTLLVFEGLHREVAEGLARTLGARFAAVSGHNKPLYHAGAVFGANYVAVMLDIAERLMSEAGVHDVRRDLVALADSALANWRNHEGPDRFTGPVIRGDDETVERHRRLLAGTPQLAELYALLADYIRRNKVAAPE